MTIIALDQRDVESQDVVQVVGKRFGEFVQRRWNKCQSIVVAVLSKVLVDNYRFYLAEVIFAFAGLEWEGRNTCDFGGRCGAYPLISW